MTSAWIFHLFFVLFPFSKCSKRFYIAIFFSGRKKNFKTGSKFKIFLFHLFIFMLLIEFFPSNLFTLLALFGIGVTSYWNIFQFDDVLWCSDADKWHKQESPVKFNQLQISFVLIDLLCFSNRALKWRYFEQKWNLEPWFIIRTFDLFSKCTSLQLQYTVVVSCSEKLYD